MNEQERGKARAVCEMFSAIAGRYDFLNHVLSANIDRYWRRTCLREVSLKLTSSGPRILDVGCGTADLSLEFSGLGPVVGCDFSEPMLRIAQRKLARDSTHASHALVGADALALPFRDGSFDVVVSAFVLRNLANREEGLRQMRRVLRSGGVLGILDFGMPRAHCLGALYQWYFRHVLPAVGKLVSGVDGAYRYLPESVQAFPPAEELKETIQACGFHAVEYRRMTGGIAVLFLARAQL